MNEHLRELSRQAYQMAVTASNTDMHRCRVGSDYFSALQHEFFAELIVKECVTVLVTEQEQVDCQWVCKNGVHIGWKIEEHFGVE